MNSIVIFDIDDTIADLSHRIHLIPTNNPQWERFFMSCLGDTPLPAIRLLISLLDNRYNVHLWTGRWDICKYKTFEWLQLFTKYRVEFWERLYEEGKFRFANNGDLRVAPVIKNEFWNLLPAYAQNDILFAVDDRSTMVDFWKARLIPCLQVHTPRV